MQDTPPNPPAEEKPLVHKIFDHMSALQHASPKNTVKDHYVGLVHNFESECQTEAERLANASGNFTARVPDYLANTCFTSMAKLLRETAYPGEPPAVAQALFNDLRAGFELPPKTYKETADHSQILGQKSSSEPKPFRS